MRIHYHLRFCMHAICIFDLLKNRFLVIKFLIFKSTCSYINTNFAGIFHAQKFYDETKMEKYYRLCLHNVCTNISTTFL